MPQAYSAPVDTLLALGEPDPGHQPWRDYPAELGLDARHLPELLRMVADPELHGADPEAAEVYAPVHAWRAIGQMRTPEAAAPLAAWMGTVKDDDWAFAELPQVFGLIGAPALAPLAQVLADGDADGDARWIAARALGRVAEAAPGTRDEVVALLAAPLRADSPESDLLNAVLVDTLLDLRAVEAAPAIQRALEDGLVNPDVVGDWEDVQVELGLLEERVTPRAPHPLVQEIAEIEERWLARGVARGLATDLATDDVLLGDGPRIASASPSASRKQRERQKNRKKMAKKSRKQNRRK